MRRPVATSRRPPANGVELGPRKALRGFGNGSLRAKSRRMAATAARSRRDGETWFWWLIGTIVALASAAMVVEKLFWWFTISAAALMFAGALVEGFYDWTHARPFSRQRQEETPKEAPASTPSTARAGGQQ